jgi:hypothetical protein
MAAVGRTLQVLLDDESRTEGNMKWFQELEQLEPIGGLSRAE